MADKTSAQTTIDAVLDRFAGPQNVRKKKRDNAFPGTPRIDRKSAGRSTHMRGAAFRAAPQRPLRIPGRG